MPEVRLPRRILTPFVDNRCPADHCPTSAVVRDELTVEQRKRADYSLGRDLGKTSLFFHKSRQPALELNFWYCFQKTKSHLCKPGFKAVMSLFSIADVEFSFGAYSSDHIVSRLGREIRDLVNDARTIDRNSDKASFCDEFAR